MGAKITKQIIGLGVFAVGDSVPVEDFRSQISQTYHTHKKQVKTLSNHYQLLQQIGHKMSNNSPTALVDDFIVRNNRSMQTILTQQLSLIGKTVKSMKKVLLVDYQSQKKTDIDDGLSVLAFGMSVVNSAKHQLSDIWEKSQNDYSMFAGDFLEKLKAQSMKDTVIVVQKDGKLNVERHYAELGQNNAASWWQKAGKILESGYIFQFAKFAYLLAKAKVCQSSTSELIEQLKKAQYFFGTDGVFDKNQANIEQQISALIGFYAALPYILRQKVQKLRNIFWIRAFLNHENRSNDLAAAFSLNNDKLGLDESLFKKSNEMIDSFNAVKASNSSLAERLEAYLQILSNYLQLNISRKKQGNKNKRMTTSQCFVNTLSKLSFHASINSINMSSFYVGLHNTMDISNVVHSTLLARRPANFDTLSDEQKEACDKDIWETCTNHYSKTILNGGPLLKTHLNHLTGIFMNFCNNFHATDPTGLNLNGHIISHHKSKMLYENFFEKAKQLPMRLNIGPQITPGISQLTTQQIIAKAMGFGLQNSAQYPLFYQVFNSGNFNFQQCSHISVGLRLIPVNLQKISPNGQPYSVYVIQIGQSVNFGLMEQYVISYQLNLSTGAQEFTDIVYQPNIIQM